MKLYKHVLLHGESCGSIETATLSDIKAYLSEQGFVAVPLEPTEAMSKAGKVAVDRTSGCSGEHDQPCAYCYLGFKHPDGCGHVAVAAYKAMIAAQEKGND